ncbi:MAG: histidine phosphatase family protein [Rikenellaceae bacterium]
MAKIYLQRHTQPDIDSNICYGVSDIALHADFESLHLPKVLQGVKELNFSKIYSSPLCRCLRLAKEIQKSKNIDSIIIDDRTVELNFGEWELAEWNEIYNSEKGKEWFADYLNCSTLQGESFADMLLRAESFLVDITKLNLDVLVVTHSGFMRAVMVAAGTIKLQEAFDVKINYGDILELENIYNER